MGGFDSHALPPAPAPVRRPRVVIRRTAHFPRARHLVVASLLGLLGPLPVCAQRADSARVAPRAAGDTTAHLLPGPPLSPRRAFLYSFVLPGYGQSVLGRPGAGALFVLTESIAIAMWRESKADLDEARRLRRDTIVVIGTDPATGGPITGRNSYDDELIAVRRGHVEDWVAFLIANHLFAAADAYVAARLWDLPSQISVRQGPTGTRIGARFRW